MRVVIDLQACQHGDHGQADAALKLAQQMARNPSRHTLWVAFSNRFPARLALLRAAFDGLLPADRVLVYDTPLADGSARAQRTIELIRNNFFAGLGADLVFAPGLFDGHADPVGTMAGTTRSFLTAVTIARAPVSVQGADRRADLLLVVAPALAASLRADPAVRVLEIGDDPQQAAQAAWDAFEKLLRERQAMPPPATRPTLAWISAGDCPARLPEELAQFYDVHLILASPPAAPAIGTDVPIHDIAWFDRHALRFDRIIYQIGNSAAHTPLLDLLARHPGVVDLHDFFLGEMVRAQTAKSATQVLRKALFDAHGYGALAAPASADVLAVVRDYPLNKPVLDAAVGVIVHSPAVAELADAWYGDGYSAQWHIVLPADGNSPSSARDYADAIEACSVASPVTHYQALLGAIAALGVPADPCHPELIAAAQAIAANQPLSRPRQLLVDVSAMVQIDMKTGISRVVRNILLALIAAPPRGYRIEPVYADAISGRYRYARQFTFALTGVEALGLDDAPIACRAGDVFLGLDLAPTATTQHAALLADMHNRGVALHFVVYDMLPLLQPDAFAYGSGASFQRYVETIARQADSLMCISRAVADELDGWLAMHPPQRGTPLSIGYFHLGADLPASAASTDVSTDAPLLFERIAMHPTLLMVGTVEPRKGHEQALAACELLWSQGLELNLVIVGKPGWLVERLIRKIEKHPRLNRNLFWLASASDDMLTGLYGACTALLAASVGEGFGLPLIEAARHGLPVIARDLPVFREVGTQYAFYFSGNDAAALAGAIGDWLTLHAAGQAPPSSGMPRLNWAQSSQQLLARILGRECYRCVAGVPPAA